jgi:hypothetical protein
METRTEDVGLTRVPTLTSSWDAECGALTQSLLLARTGVGAQDVDWEELLAPPAPGCAAPAGMGSWRSVTGALLGSREGSGQREGALAGERACEAGEVPGRRGRAGPCGRRAAWLGGGSGLDTRIPGSQCPSGQLATSRVRLSPPRPPSPEIFCPHRQV